MNENQTPGFIVMALIKPLHATTTSSYKVRKHFSTRVVDLNKVKSVYYDLCLCLVITTDKRGKRKASVEL